MKLRVKSILLAAAVAASSLAASTASAVTVYFSDYVTGEDLGLQNVAILEATQVGADVHFALSNTMSGTLSTAFIGAIGFSYAGTAPTSVTNLAGSDAVATGIGNGGLNGAGLSIDFGTLFANGSGNPDALSVGETALFALESMDLNLFDFASFETAVHLQGLDSNDLSSKYTSGDCVGPSCGGGGGFDVPLPAGLPLLFTGLGAFGLMRRRSRKTA